MKISSLFISLIIILFACAETPKKEKPMPLSESRLDFSFSDEDIKIALDTNFRIGQDSLNIFCAYKTEEAAWLQIAFWNGTQWQITQQDTLPGAMDYSLKLGEDVNKDGFSDVYLVDDDGSQVLQVYVYNNKNKTFNLVQDSLSNSVFIAYVDGEYGMQAEEILLAPSQKHKKYYYSYQYYVTADDSDQQIVCGYFQDSMFYEIAVADWQSEDADFISYYFASIRNGEYISNGKLFAKVRLKKNDDRSFREIMIAYFEKNLPQIIQKHKALK